MKKIEMFQEFTTYDRDMKPVDAVRKMDSRSLLDMSCPQLSVCKRHTLCEEQ